MTVEHSLELSKRCVTRENKTKNQNSGVVLLIKEPERYNKMKCIILDSILNEKVGRKGKKDGGRKGRRKNTAKRILCIGTTGEI